MRRGTKMLPLILAVVVALSLRPLIVCIEVQAQIAFASDRDGNYEIYVMDTDGRNQRRLTENPAHDLQPSWSPDGEHIAFVSDRDGNQEIYVMDADGKNQRRLTRNGSPDTDPSLSLFLLDMGTLKST